MATTDLPATTGLMWLTTDNSTTSSLLTFNGTEVAVIIPMTTGVRVFIIAVSLFIALLATLFNVPVLVAWAVGKRQRHTPTSAIVYNLMIFDMSIAASLYLRAVILLNTILAKSGFLCTFHFAFLIHGGMGMQMALLLTVLDRYVAVMYPLHYHQILTYKMVSLCVASIHISIFLFSFAPLLPDFNNWGKTTNACVFNRVLKKGYLYSILIFIMVLMVGALALYARVLHTARRHRRRIMMATTATVRPTLPRSEFGTDSHLNTEVQNSTRVTQCSQSIAQSQMEEFPQTSAIITQCKNIGTETNPPSRISVSPLNITPNTKLNVSVIENESGRIQNGDEMQNNQNSALIGMVASNNDLRMNASLPETYCALPDVPTVTNTQDPEEQLFCLVSRPIFSSRGVSPDNSVPTNNDQSMESKASPVLSNSSIDLNQANCASRPDAVSNMNGTDFIVSSVNNSTISNILKKHQAADNYEGFTILGSDSLQFGPVDAMTRSRSEPASPAFLAMATDVNISLNNMLPAAGSTRLFIKTPSLLTQNVKPIPLIPPPDTAGTEMQNTVLTFIDRTKEDRRVNNDQTGHVKAGDYNTERGQTSQIHTITNASNEVSRTCPETNPGKNDQERQAWSSGPPKLHTNSEITLVVRELDKDTASTTVHARQDGGGNTEDESRISTAGKTRKKPELKKNKKKFRNETGNRFNSHVE